MKILHINCADYGSTGAIIDSIAKYSGFEHILCAPYITRNHNKLKTYGVCLPHELGVCKRMAYALGYQYGFAPLSTRKIKHIILKEAPGIVHLHSANCNVVNLYSLIGFLKRHKIPFIVTNHAEFFYTGSCSHALDCERWKLGCGNCPRLRFAANTWRDTTAQAWKKMKKAFTDLGRCCVVSVSPWQLSRSQQSPILAGVRQCCIENGIDTSFFSEKELPAEHGRRVALLVTANFDPEDHDSKGGYYLLELSRLLIHEGIQFVVVGRSKVTDVSDENVHIVGMVRDKNELADYYRNADVVLTVSQRETYGMTVAEALLCGTPVVGFKNGGSDSIAIPQHTQFVEFGDTASLAAAVKKWINYKDTHMREIASDAKKIYSDKVMAEKYEKLYKEVVG